MATYPDPSAARDVTATHAPHAAARGGRHAKASTASGFLGIALMNINSYWHPTLLWHMWKDWDGKETFDAPPLLYENAPDDLACDAMSAEVGEVVAALRRRYGDSTHRHAGLCQIRPPMVPAELRPRAIAGHFFHGGDDAH